MGIVFVPLSSSWMNDRRSIGTIVQLLEDHPTQARRIAFAIERADPANDPERVRHFASTLRRYGCKFMLADLGFGTQAIELLKMMRADFLGIPGGLVENMLDSSVDYEAILALSRVANSLGMRTIAAQADTKSLTNALRKLGIDYAVGKLYERPRPVSAGKAAQSV